MADFDKKTVKWKQQGVEEKSKKQHAAIQANMKTALLSVAVLLPLVIIAANFSAKSGPSVKTGPKYDGNALFSSEPAPAEVYPPASSMTKNPSEPTTSPSSAISSATHAAPLDEPTDAVDNPNDESAANATSKAGPPEVHAAGTTNETGVENASTVSGSKVAYITIDDGPSREVTLGILDLLQKEGIKATFFVLPHSGCRDIYRRIIDEGHEIGNHSYSHNYSKLYNSKEIWLFEEDVLLAQEWMFDNFGYLTTSFRFPGGAMGRKESIISPRREFLAEHGYRDFDWDVDTGDANTNLKDKSADTLSQRVLDNTRDRGQLIVLMHDTKSKETTLEALPMIIAGLREQGYSFDIMRNY